MSEICIGLSVLKKGTLITKHNNNKTVRIYSREGELYLRCSLESKGDSKCCSKHKSSKSLKINSEFNELNDYSYTEFQNYQQTRKITVYWDGELIWGDEPSGAADENNSLVDSGSNGKWSFNRFIH